MKVYPAGKSGDVTNSKFESSAGYYLAYLTIERSFVAVSDFIFV